MIKGAIRALVGCGLAALVAACGAGPGAVTTVGQQGAVPGSFGDFAVQNYNDPTNNLFNEFIIQNAVDSYLKQHNWNDISYQQDANVSAQSFSSIRTTADAIFFAGHGNTGLLAFSNVGNPSAPVDQRYFGPGSADGSVPSNLDGTPLSGTLKWMFLSSSDTVAPSLEFDPIDSQAYLAPSQSWKNVFGNFGTLRGIYGYWQSPGACPSQNNYSRACDVYEGPDYTAMKDLLQHIVVSSGPPETIHDAWANANRDANMSDMWSALEDCNALNDTFSGQTNTVNDPTLSNTLCYTAPYFGNNSVRQAMGQGGGVAQTFTLSPMAMSPVAVNVAGIISSVQANFPIGTVTTTDDGAVRTYTSQGGLAGKSYYGQSTGVTYHGHSHSTAIAFTQASAQAAATQYVQSSFGFPSDAALSQVIPIYRFNTSGSRTLVEYEFVWRHSAGNIVGGDAIKVVVDDIHQTQKVCTQPNENDPPYNKPPCYAYQINVTDTPGVPYAYFLWRNPVSSQYVAMGGRVSGGASMDAFTAASSLYNSKSIVSYTSGYWTGPIDQQDNTLHPAWLYTVQSGHVEAVDAFTGQYLGTTE